MTSANNSELNQIWNVVKSSDGFLAKVKELAVEADIDEGLSQSFETTWCDEPVFVEVEVPEGANHFEVRPQFFGQTLVDVIPAVISME